MVINIGLLIKKIKNYGDTCEEYGYDGLGQQTKENRFEEIKELLKHPELMNGPTGDPKCPECGNSFDLGIPSDSPDKRRCASCKHVWDVLVIECQRLF